MKSLIISLLFLIISCNVLAISPGDKAPNFKLLSHNNTEVELSKINKGQYVILEWYNHGCPYVRKHYDSKNMQTIQNLYKDNDLVTWLTISSSAEGRQGYLKDSKTANEQKLKEGMTSKFLLLDHDGKVGQLYNAKTTPQIIIIDHKGIVQYTGAIDSIPSASKGDIAKAKNYVTSSMNKIMLNEKPNPQKTRPYGCSVKY